MNNVSFSSNNDFNNQAIAVFVGEDLMLDENARGLDQDHHGVISKTIQNKLSFAGKFGQHKVLTSTDKNGDLKFLILIGLGEEKKLKSHMFEQLGGKIYQCASAHKIESVNVLTPSATG